MTIKNVFIVGSGNVAKICLANLATKDIGAENQLNVIVYNPTRSHAEGIVKDAKSSSMSRMSDIIRSSSSSQIAFSSTDKLEKMADADLVIVLSGKFPSQEVLAKARLNGTDREVQSTSNYQDIKTLAQAFMQYNGKALVLMVTNPVDYFTRKFQELSGYDPKKILGFGCALDSHRFMACLKDELELTQDIRVHRIKAHMVGFHNKDMFPHLGSIRINGYSLEQCTHSQFGIISKEAMGTCIDKAVDATRKYGAEITELNKNKIGASIDAGNLLGEFIGNYCFGIAYWVMPFTYYFPQASKQDDVQEYNGLKNTYFSYPMHIGVGKIEPIFPVFGDEFSQEEGRLRDLAIKNFNESVAKLDAFIQENEKIHEETVQLSATSCLSQDPSSSSSAPFSMLTQFALSNSKPTLSLVPVLTGSGSLGDIQNDTALNVKSNTAGSNDSVGGTQKTRERLG